MEKGDTGEVPPAECPYRAKYLAEQAEKKKAEEDSKSGGGLEEVEVADAGGEEKHCPFAHVQKAKEQSSQKPVIDKTQCPFASGLKRAQAELELKEKLEEKTVVDEDFYKPKDITPDKDGGVMKEIIRKGWGKVSPLQGDKVKVHYVGTLLDGTKFDSSRDRGEFFEFELGKGRVIKAWDLGVATMVQGELSKFTCRADYAYGETGAGDKIPPNATLVFEVQLFDWEGEDLSPIKDEKAIIRRNIKHGEGYKEPNDGATVEVHLKGTFENRVFDDRTVKFVVGEGLELNVIEGLEHAVKKFRQYEKSLLSIKSKYAWGAEGCEEFKIPPNADVEYEMELLNFEKVKAAWEMDFAEKLEQTEIIKGKGTEYFKQGKYKLAIKQYKKIIEYLEKDLEEEIPSDDHRKKRKDMLLAAFLNMGLAYLKTSSFYEAKQNCDSALEIDPKCEKGYFRRGMAEMERYNFEEAEKDFGKVLEIDPNNKAAKNQLIQSRQKSKVLKEKEKKKYFGMFDKLAKMDRIAAMDRERERREGRPGDVIIDEWQNRMADGMIPLEKEAEAFGEEVKKRGEVTVDDKEDGDDL